MSNMARVLSEKFEGTKGVIWNRKSKDRQYNRQKEKEKKEQTIIYKHDTHKKLKIEQHEPNYKSHYQINKRSTNNGKLDSYKIPTTLNKIKNMSYVNR